MHRRGVDVVVPLVADRPVDPQRTTEVPGPAEVLLEQVRDAAGNRRRVALRRVRVVRVQRAVGRGAGRDRAARADVDRQLQDRVVAVVEHVRRGAVAREVERRRRVGADRRRDVAVERLRLLEAERRKGFGFRTDRRGHPGGGAEALHVRRDHAVEFGQVFLADRPRGGRGGVHALRKLVRGRRVGREAAAAVQQLVARGLAGRKAAGPRNARTHDERRGDAEAAGVTVRLQPVDDAVEAAGAVVADLREVIGVERIGPLAVLQHVLVVVEPADVGVEAVLGEVAEAGGQRHALLPGVAALRDAGFHTAADALDFLLGDDVDHAGDRVGAVRRGRAVAQHLDVLDDVVGDRVQVDEVARAVIGQRVVRGAHAVEQHQRRVGGQAAQRDRRGARRERAVGGERVGQRRAVVG